MEPDSNPTPLVVIVGETASGKSEFAIKAAKKFGGELICADSWTVRSEADVGTAKPSPSDRSQVPHHLVDVVKPCQDFSAAAFKRLALASISDVASRSNFPIMVGGTGLYIDSVIFDYSFLPSPPKQLRIELDALSIGELLVRINRLGYSLEGIDIRNKRRLVRLIETGGVRPQKQKMRPNTLVIGISRDRQELNARIAKRVDQMIDNGLEQEVRTLSEKYGWGCEALKGIGYQEWKLYFEGSQSFDQTKQRIIKNTLSLAKRQRTWFKRNKNINWICKTDEMIELITTFLNNQYTKD